MMQVGRYDLEFANSYSDAKEMKKSEDGDWVKYEEISYLLRALFPFMEVGLRSAEVDANCRMVGTIAIEHCRDFLGMDKRG